MMAVFLPKLRQMAVSVRVPSTRGSAWKDGAAISVKSGTKVLCSSRLVTLMSMLRAKWLSQAVSVITRTARR